MYSIAAYSRMILDTVRMEAYEQALEASVRPGSVVVDIGCGTGIASLLACRFGARKVYAIEPDAAVLVAKEIAKVNGCDDRIEFIQDLSTNVKLPEKADVVVSDMRGILPFLSHHLPSLAHAREELLKPDGLLIPHKDTLWATVVNGDDENLEEHWTTSYLDFDYRPSLRFISNGHARYHPPEEKVLARPSSWGELNYNKLESPNHTGTAKLKIDRAGTGHGVLVWFDAELIPGVGFSNAPDKPRAIYGQMFYPWTQPVELAVGDEVELKLSADLVASEYLWRWETKINRAAGGDPIKYQQSSFFASPMAVDKLRKRAASFVPSINEEGEVAALILAGIRDGEELGVIAERLHSSFPDRFPTTSAALGRVGELSVEFSK